MLDILILVPEITKGMKSLGSKALLKIKSSTMVLEYQIEQIRRLYGKSRIFIGTGFESEKIKKLFTGYTNLYFIDDPEYNTTNQAKLISLFAQNYSSTKLLIISNGILFKNNPFVCDDQSKIFLIDKPKNHFNIGCNAVDPVLYLFYDLPIAWAECVFFDAEAIRNIKHMSQTKNINQMYLFEIINKLIEEHDTNFVSDIVKKKDIMKINTAKDISKAKLFI